MSRGYSIDCLPLAFCFWKWHCLPNFNTEILDSDQILSESKQFRNTCLKSIESVQSMNSNAVHEDESEVIHTSNHGRLVNLQPRSTSPLVETWKVHLGKTLGCATISSKSWYLSFALGLFVHVKVVRW